MQKWIGSEIEEESNGSLEGGDARQGEQIGYNVPAGTAYYQVGSSDGEEQDDNQFPNHTQVTVKAGEGIEEEAQSQWGKMSFSEAALFLCMAESHKCRTLFFSGLLPCVGL